MEHSRPSSPSAPWWRGRGLVIGVPYAWLLLFFLAPFLIVAKYSISEMGDVRVEDLVTYTNGAVKLAAKLTNGETAEVPGRATTQARRGDVLESASRDSSHF